VGGGFLHVAQRYPGVQSGGDKRVAQRMRPDRLGDPGAARDPADNPSGTVPVQPLSAWGEEDRPLCVLADSQADRPRRPRCEGDGDHLAALAGNDQGAVPALDAQGFNVGASGFGYTQPVERQQRDQRMLGRSA
jgi:hypothetical protein